MQLNDKPLFRALAAQVVRELANVAEANEVTFEYAGGTVAEAEAILKLRVRRTGGDQQEAIDFRRYAGMVGLEPSDFGREFVHDDHRYRITGLKPNCRRHPVLGERLADGKRMRFSPRLVLRGFQDAPSQ